MSRARLERMHDVMAGHVDRGVVPGVVTLVNLIFTAINLLSRRVAWPQTLVARRATVQHEIQDKVVFEQRL
jgi:hypothetical protein